VCLSFQLLHFPFIWCQNPGESLEQGGCPSWVTVIPWWFSCGQWCTPMWSAIWGWYGCTKPKRHLCSPEKNGWSPPPYLNHLTSLQISLSFSLSSFPLNYLLYVSTTIIPPAEPPIILLVLLGMGWGATAPSNWTTVQKLLVIFFYLITTLFWAWSFGHTCILNFLLLCNFLEGPLRILLCTSNTGSNFCMDE
jgi:hypothetical protein